MRMGMGMAKDVFSYGRVFFWLLVLYVDVHGFEWDVRLTHKCCGLHVCEHMHIKETRMTLMLPTDKNKDDSSDSNGACTHASAQTHDLRASAPTQAAFMETYIHTYTYLPTYIHVYICVCMCV